MKFLGQGLKSAVAVSAIALFVAACGGSSEPAATSDPAPAAPDVSEAADTAAETVEAAAAEASDTVEAAAEETTEAVTEAATEAAETVEAAAEEAAAEVETAAAEEAAPAGSDDRVTPAIVAQYEALTGNAANGRRIFTQCMACHSANEGVNLAAPSLYGIVGRPAGTIPNFNYSPANKDSGITWTEPTMFAYLANPQAFIPGTLMIFPGLPKPQDRADVIAYLKENAE